MISFRPLTDKDALLLQKWLNVDFVTKWYERRKFLYDDVEKEYLMPTKLSTPIESYITLIDDKPIGYIHTYKISDYPQFALSLLVDQKTYGMDMFIGERDYLGKGYGKDIISIFVQDIVFKKQDVKACVSCFDPDDIGSIHVYKKAGFVNLKTVEWEGKPEYVMVRYKKISEQTIFTHSPDSTEES